MTTVKTTDKKSSNLIERNIAELFELYTAIAKAPNTLKSFRGFKDDTIVETKEKAIERILSLQTALEKEQNKSSNSNLFNIEKIIIQKNEYKIQKENLIEQRKEKTAAMEKLKAAETKAAAEPKTPADTAGAKATDTPVDQDEKKKDLEGEKALLEQNLSSFNSELTKIKEAIKILDDFSAKESDNSTTLLEFSADNVKEKFAEEINKSMKVQYEKNKNFILAYQSSSIDNKLQDLNDSEEYKDVTNKASYEAAVLVVKKQIEIVESIKKSIKDVKTEETNKLDQKNNAIIKATKDIAVNLAKIEGEKNIVGLRKFETQFKLEKEINSLTNQIKEIDSKVSKFKLTNDELLKKAIISAQPIKYDGWFSKDKEDTKIIKEQEQIDIDIKDENKLASDLVAGKPDIKTLLGFITAPVGDTSTEGSESEMTRLEKLMKDDNSSFADQVLTAKVLIPTSILGLVVGGGFYFQEEIQNYWNELTGKNEDESNLDGNGNEID